MKTEKKIGKNLQPGDVVVGMGIILKIETKPAIDDFYCGKPWVEYMSLNDAYYGSGTREINLKKEFDVIVSRLDIIEAYERIDGEIAKYIADMMEFRKRYNSLQHDFFTAYNKKYPRKKAGEADD